MRAIRSAKGNPQQSSEKISGNSSNNNVNNSYSNFSGSYSNFSTPCLPCVAYIRVSCTRKATTTYKGVTGSGSTSSSSSSNNNAGGGGYGPQNYEGFNLTEITMDDQVKLCQEIAYRHNLTISCFVKRIGSAYQTNNLVALVDALYNANTHRVVVCDISRLSRRVKWLEETLVPKIGTGDESILPPAVVYSGKLVYDTSCPEQRNLLRIAVSHSQYESECISTRIREHRRIRAASNVHLRPYGQNDSTEEHVVRFIVNAAFGRRTVQCLNLLMSRFCEMDAPIEISNPSRNCQVILTSRNIAEILNTYDVTKRGKIWTTNMVNYLATKHCHSHHELDPPPAQSSALDMRVIGQALPNPSSPLVVSANAPRPPVVKKKPAKKKQLPAAKKNHHRKPNK